jgi:hypothetical protein
MSPIVCCPGIIALTSGNIPNYTVIPILKVWEARRTLGVRPAPDSDYQKEGEFLLNKANQYAKRLSMSNLSKMDIFIFHCSTYVPSINDIFSAGNNVRSKDSEQDPMESDTAWSEQVIS